MSARPLSRRMISCKVLLCPPASRFHLVDGSNVMTHATGWSTRPSTVSRRTWPSSETRRALSIADMKNSPLYNSDVGTAVLEMNAGGRSSAYRRSLPHSPSTASYCFLVRSMHPLPYDSIGSQTALSSCTFASREILLFHTALRDLAAAHTFVLRETHSASQEIVFVPKYLYAATTGIW